MDPGTRSLIRHGGVILATLTLAAFYLIIGEVVFLFDADTGLIVLPCVVVLMMILVAMKRYRSLALYNAIVFVLIVARSWSALDIGSIGVAVAAWAVAQVLITTIALLGRRSGFRPSDRLEGRS